MYNDIEIVGCIRYIIRREMPASGNFIELLLRAHSSLTINSYNITDCCAGEHLYIEGYNTFDMLNDYMYATYDLKNYLFERNSTSTYTFYNSICIFKNEKTVVVKIIQNIDYFVMITRVIKEIIDTVKDILPQ